MQICNNFIEIQNLQYIFTSIKTKSFMASPPFFWNLSLIYAPHKASLSSANEVSLHQTIPTFGKSSYWYQKTKKNF